ncbi:MAG TPA: GumC family protein, partial [Beijerinckiaceae bacterium]|nr:GumC family protein [Beijerinckiaceae bacterium]
MSGDVRPGSSGEYDSGEGDVELRAIGRAIRRKKGWIIAATLVAFLGTLTFVFLVKPRYTADSQVLLENQENFLTKPDYQVDPAQAPDAEAVASQIQLVTSRDLARQAIKALHLKGDPEFDPNASGGLLGRISGLLGLSRPASALSEEDRILKAYFERLTVFQIVKSRVLQIEFTSQDPALAARAANTIANLYISVQIAAKHDRAKAEAASLAVQIAKLRARLSVAEDKAESFRASSGMLMGANNVTLTTQQLADLSTQLVAARTAQAEAQAKAKLIRAMLSKGRLDQVSDVANNALIRQLSEQRITLRSQLALESRTLLPGHPKIKELDAQIAELNHELRNAAQNVAHGLENDSEIAGARLNSIHAILDEQKQAVGDSGAKAVRLREFDRDAKLIRAQLEASTTRYQEAVERETSTSTPGDARVISQAMSPQNPSFPKKAPMLIFATLAGFVLSSAIVIAGALMSGGVEGQRDLAKGSRAFGGEETAGVDEADEVEDERREALAADAALARRRRAAALAEPPAAILAGVDDTKAPESAPSLAERVL